MHDGFVTAQLLSCGCAEVDSTLCGWAFRLLFQLLPSHEPDFGEHPRVPVVRVACRLAEWIAEVRGSAPSFTSQRGLVRSLNEWRSGSCSMSWFESGRVSYALVFWGGRVRRFCRPSSVAPGPVGGGKLLLEETLGTLV